jgi:hypothetical protein
MQDRRSLLLPLLAQQLKRNPGGQFVADCVPGVSRRHEIPQRQE